MGRGTSPSEGGEKWAGILALVRVEKSGEDYYLYLGSRKVGRARCSEGRGASVWWLLVLRTWRYQVEIPS